MKEKRSRELDNSAKLFPLVICKKYNGTFRISFTLSSNINEYQLQKATMKTLDEIPFFKFKLKRGLFWHYLVLNNSPVVINKSSKKICNKINFKDNNNYLFNITYSNNKVNVDILHYLCDGISGKIFVNKILENYLIINNNHPNVFNSKINYTINDDYIKNYNQKIKSVKEKENTTNIYKVKGTLLQDNNIDITKLNINLKSLKRKSQKKQCSVTEYICGILIYSIINTSTYKSTINKRIRVCVPIDLRNYFKSSTLKNFFAYMYIESDKSEFDLIIKDVKEQFRTNLENESLQKKINKLVDLGTNKIIKKIPLFLKRVIVQIFYWKIANNSTIILSNFGEFKIKENVESFETMIEPDPTKLIKCCFCSYDNTLSLIFSSKIEEKDLEQVFLREIQIKLND